MPDSLPPIGQTDSFTLTMTAYSLNVRYTLVAMYWRWWRSSAGSVTQ